MKNKGNKKKMKKERWKFRRKKMKKDRNKKKFKWLY
jgi:hypothetical protein